MKLTKQESAMVKLAAAWMAPQMVKKATLQDKLAAYGIGTAKQAADADGKWTAPALPTAGIAQAAKPPVDWSKALGQDKTLKAQAGTQAPLKGHEVAAPSGKQRLLNAAQNYMRNAGKAAQQGVLTGHVIGSVLRGAKPAGAPATASAAQPAAAPAGKMEAQRDPGQKPMIGASVPTDAAIENPYDVETGRQYPYMSQRAGNQDWARVGGREKAVENARIFDNALNHVMERNGGVMDQAAVESARKAQATELAKQISAPGTNQYDDAIQMLIQAGKNNQEMFENSGNTKGTGPSFDAPTGYEGQNRLNGFQRLNLNKLFPAMGDTTNSRRFAGHA